MDRRGKRHLTGDKSQRCDRKRKRLRPSNQFESAEKDINISTSARKLSSDDDSEVTINPSVSYRLLNFITVFAELSQYVKCKVCESDVTFCENSRRGLGFKLL